MNGVGGERVMDVNGLNREPGKMSGSIVRYLWKWLPYLAMAVVSVPSHAQTTVEYIHTDALGTPVAVTNSLGAVIERSEYEPYGKLLNRPLADGPGFTGHVQDAVTGLTYMQQRYYDPMIGRFLSVDPVTANSGTGANFNRYWYANNNPYKFFDPDGRQSIEDGPDEHKTLGPCDLNPECWGRGGGSGGGGDESRSRDNFSDAGDDELLTMKDRSYAILEKPAGEDGVVNLSMTEFGQLLDFEVAHTQMRSNLRGGYSNLPARETLWEARHKGDSLFFGTFGGTNYRVITSSGSSIGPFKGGDFNYLKQGIIFSASGDSVSEMRGMIILWNASGAGTISNLPQRLYFGEVGYYYNELRNGD